MATDRSLTRLDRLSVGTITIAVLLWAGGAYWISQGAPDAVVQCTGFSWQGDPIVADPGDWAELRGYESQAVCTGNGDWSAR